MKIKTTRKAVVNASARIVSAGYCSLYNLLRPVDPIAYTCGVYGWNFDVYEVEGVTICTGYRGMPGRSANNAKEYEEKARAIWDSAKDWETKRAEGLDLLREFAAQA